MAQFNPHGTTPNNATYTPPRLPACLADAHTLKPIIGVPTDEEVKAIHAALRALNSILSVPALYDPDLPMQLAQHLFEVQMAVYRSKYSCNILLGDAIFNPPPLPSHIPINLEPVVGAPSDEQLKLAQSAVRALDILTNDPAAFDAELNMNLSQHLFNIQIARYVQQSTQGKFASQTKQVQPEEQRIAGMDPLPERRVPEQPPESPHFSAQFETKVEVALEPANCTLSETGDLLKVALGEANCMLSGIGDLLKKMNRVLISTQHTMIGNGSNWSAFVIVNEEGDVPMRYNLPRLWEERRGGRLEICKRGGGALTDQELAGYLKFYNIGGDLIQDGIEPTIIPGKKQEAEKLLYDFVYTNLGYEPPNRR